VPVKVDHAKLERAVQTLKDMAAKDRWLGEIAMRVSAGGMKLVADEYRTSTDPYGKPWAPLKQCRTRDKRAARRRAKQDKPVRGPKVLINTGRMRASTGASPSGKIAKVVVPTWYARFHQEGTCRMVQRMILPMSEKLPATWDTMIGRETSRFMRQRFGVR
jgi:hypothetical protein